MVYDVLIIGGGAAGLIAMKELVQRGYKVCLLEATPLAGGRISTIHHTEFVYPLEKGAEFIHGIAPVTLNLLKEANIPYAPSTEKMYAVQNGIWLNSEEEDTFFDDLLEKIRELKEDTTLADFLDAYFPAGEYDRLRKSVTGFAEGFSLMDINKASTIAFGKEWEAQQEEQYCLPGGYAQLINYLLKQCQQSGSSIHFSSPVVQVDHQKDLVTVRTVDGQKYKAKKIVVTVSLGVLQSGDIAFSPALSRQAPYLQNLGFGSVVKIHLVFKQAFWDKQIPGGGFILSDEQIPTWWTQPDSSIPVLTGWVGGPSVKKLNLLDEQSLLNVSLSSLATIFHVTLDLLHDHLLHAEHSRWDHAQFTKGGYSYTAVNSIEAKQVLSEPVDNTIYFAGEAFYEGELQGTVEAALASGKSVAEKIIRSFID